MYGIVIYFSFLSGQAFAECKKPVQAVETKRQEELSGEMSATVLNFGGGVSKGKKTETTWQASLPSQSAIDNQWYLYLLCQDYEAGRLTKEQYCDINSGLWSRIAGVPVSAESCLSSGEPNEIVELTEIVEPTENSQSGTIVSDDQVPAHWTGVGIGSDGFDLFGPYGVEPAIHYYLDNRRGCITKLVRQNDATLLEEVLIGQCTAWSSVKIERTNKGLILEGDGKKNVLQATGKPADDNFFGTWSGQSAKQGKKILDVRATLFGNSSLTEIELSINEDNKGGVVKYNSTCPADLKIKAKGHYWVEFREFYETDIVGTLLGTGCIPGSITLIQLELDMVLFFWSNNTGEFGAVLQRQ